MDSQGKVVRMKPKDEIEKELPQPNYTLIKKHPTTVSRRVNDNYGRSIFYNDQDVTSQSSALRTETIGKIFSSDALRYASLKPNSEKLGFTEKIVNTPIKNNVFPSAEPPKFIKTERKLIMGNQVVYP